LLDALAQQGLVHVTEGGQFHLVAGQVEQTLQVRVGPAAQADQGDPETAVGVLPGGAGGGGGQRRGPGGREEMTARRGHGETLPVGLPSADEGARSPRGPDQGPVARPPAGPPGRWSSSVNDRLPAAAEPPALRRQGSPGGCGSTADKSDGS